MHAPTARIQPQERKLSWRQYWAITRLALFMIFLLAIHRLVPAEAFRTQRWLRRIDIDRPEDMLL
jgi:hypothetical protein